MSKSEKVRSVITWKIRSGVWRSEGEKDDTSNKLQKITQLKQLKTINFQYTLTYFFFDFIVSTNGKARVATIGLLRCPFEQNLEKFQICCELKEHVQRMACDNVTGRLNS